MAEIIKNRNHTSEEEPTDKMLQAIMERVAAEAIKSKAKAQAEKQRRLQAVANEISEWKATR
ncbi:MAG: hypothetical protein IJS19_01045 [Muribaculaceae bacterium]|nr:hypothetical protein [Muribaculaceae bacterium]